MSRQQQGSADGTRARPTNCRRHLAGPRSATLALAVTLAWGVPSAAAAADGRAAVDVVEGLIAKADFDQAETVARAIIELGSIEPRELAALHTSLGVVGAAKGQTGAALSEFALALRLDSDAAPRKTAGPSVQRLFASARQQVAEEPKLGVSLKLTRRDGTTLLVNAEANSSASSLVRSLRIDGVSGPRVVAWPHPNEPLAVELELGEDLCSTLTASAADAHGNVVLPRAAELPACPVEAEAKRSIAPPPVAPGAERSATPPPTAPAPAPPPTAPRSDSRRIGTPVWISAGLTAAALATTVELGLVASRRRDDYRASVDDPEVSLTQKWELRERANEAQERATVAGVATALLGVGTLTLYVLDARARAAPTLAWNARHNTLTLSGRF